MSTTFSVRLNEGPEQQITVETGIYRSAAIAAPAILGRPELPMVVEIWVPEHLPDYRPLFWELSEDERGGIRVWQVVPTASVGQEL
jgi:hypothetical protein